MRIRLACLVIFLVTAPVTAMELQLDSGLRQVTLLELYTSQGCSSCPPAERWLNEYVDSDKLWTRVVPIALHVDYWDYIGWKDVYARKEFGDRQRSYARADRARTVYTPGLFVNGREWRGWTLRLDPRHSDRQAGNLNAVISDNHIRASFADTSRPLDLHVAILGFGIETPVKRGENRNRTLAQEFVVLEYALQRSANGSWTSKLPVVNAAGVKRYAIALWVSEPGNPVPLQATGGWLPQAP